MFQATEYYGREHESLEGISTEDFVDLLEPKLEYALSIDGLAARLAEGEPLRVKMGIDPTGPDIHLGHVVPVRALDLFRRAGHSVDLIFGDFTAKIGDPSGRSDGRKTLTDEEIGRNVASYKGQVHNYFDTDARNVTIHRNSLWLGALALPEVFQYLQMVNLTQATQRRDFRTRMEAGNSVTLAEAMYGTLQGIDSVHLRSDVEIGGIDQLLNVSQARDVQRNRGQRPEEVLLTPIIQGTTGDGRKMSKSYGNYIPATASPDEIFGKIMSIPDTHVVPYLVAFAPIHKRDVETLTLAARENPLELKKQLATYLAAVSAGSLSAGMEARETFDRRFARREFKEDEIVTITAAPDDTVLAIIGRTVGLSNNEVRRLANGGGIKVNGVKITEEGLHELPARGTALSVGKRRHYTVEHANDA